MGLSTRSKFLKRFELHQLFNNHLATYEHIERDIKKCMNIILSQMTSVNHQVSEVHHFNLIRLYLIKSYRGKAQAIGKPCRGQRT
jgi:ribosomal protein S13